MTARSERPRPSGWLLRQIPRVVAQMPGGGCSRAELAAALHVPGYGEVFEASVRVCYWGRRGIDLCDGYVAAVRPEPRRKAGVSGDGERVRHPPPPLGAISEQVRRATEAGVAAAAKARKLPEEETG